MLRSYRDSVCLVTGGASGIGEALSRELARRGAHVILADRQQERAAAVAKEIESAGGRARAAVLDVRDAEAFETLVRDTLSDAGRLDYLFNNAGIGVGGFFEDHSIDDWRYIVDVNLMGVVHGAHAAYPRMCEQGFGHIVNTASMAGQMGVPGLASYSATKHAVVGLSRSLRAEGIEYGVRVSAFCPGVINTPILDGGGAYGRILGPASLQEAQPEDLGRAMDVTRFAQQALDAVAKNREIIVLPSAWRILWAFDRLFPTLGSRLTAWQYRRGKAKLLGRASSETQDGAP
ncbi:MAG: SDR family oxidoreductase [Myxococcota bacterium]